jgi:hypothetical protein
MNVMDKIKIVETKEINNNKLENLNSSKLDKFFLKSVKELSLIEGLNTYTKSELNDIRQALDIRGISSLKKADLIDVLAREITIRLPQIIKMLSSTEYKLLKYILAGKGFIKFNHRFQGDYLTIRKYGIVIASQFDNMDRILFIPRELRKGLRLIIPSSIKGNKNKKSKIGRNEICPCGSGLKYKKCCLNLYLQKVV